MNVRPKQRNTALPNGREGVLSIARRQALTVIRHNRDFRNAIRSLTPNTEVCVTDLARDFFPDRCHSREELHYARLCVIAAVQIILRDDEATLQKLRSNGKQASLAKLAQRDHSLSSEKLQQIFEDRGTPLWNHDDDLLLVMLSSKFVHPEGHANAGQPNHRQIAYWIDRLSFGGKPVRDSRSCMNRLAALRKNHQGVVQEAQDRLANFPIEAELEKLRLRYAEEKPDPLDVLLEENSSEAA